MKKKRNVYIAVGLAVCFVAACIICATVIFRPFVGVSSREISPEGELRFSVDAKSISASSALFCLENTTNEEIFYDEHNILQRKLLGKWWEYEYPYPSIALEGDYIEPGESIELAFDWQELYGELPRGSYRIVKEYFVYDYTDVEPDKHGEIGPTKKCTNCEFKI